jgi:hypothetical protein
MLNKQTGPVQNPDERHEVVRPGEPVLLGERGAPSERQLLFATKLSKDLNLGPVPEKIQMDRGAMTEYIKSLVERQHLQRAANPASVVESPPTARQVPFPLYSGTRTISLVYYNSPVQNCNRRERGTV